MLRKSIGRSTNVNTKTFFWKSNLHLDAGWNAHPPDGNTATEKIPTCANSETPNNFRLEEKYFECVPSTLNVRCKPRQQLRHILNKNTNDSVSCRWILLKFSARTILDRVRKSENNHSKKTPSNWPCFIVRLRACHHENWNIVIFFIKRSTHTW